MKPVRTLHVMLDAGSRWRWRSYAPNGRITAISGESFASKSNAIRAARREAALIAGVTVVKED